MSEKAIDYRFKILYAVGIIMVVCGHTQGGGITILSDWFPYEGIHLALFMFCSGYFYKSKVEGNIRQYVLKKVKTLLVPLYLYNIAYGIFVQLTRLKAFEIGGDFTLHNILIAPITNGHQFIYNMGGWFIAPLFMVEVYNVLLRKLLKNINKNIPEIVFFIINVCLGLIGNWMACSGYRDGLWLVVTRMLYFIPFYGLGIFYKNVLEKYEKKLPGFWYLAVIFGIKLWIIYYYGKVPAYTPSWCDDFNEGIVMPILVGYTGIALWMRIASILEPVIGRSKWVNLIADNTYSIMINQFLGFMIVKGIFGLLGRVYTEFVDFSWDNFKTDIGWYYRPKGLWNSLILYVIGGIVFSIAVQKALDHVKLLWRSQKKKGMTK